MNRTTSSGPRRGKSVGIGGCAKVKELREIPPEPEYCRAMRCSGWMKRWVATLVLVAGCWTGSPAPQEPAVKPVAATLQVGVERISDRDWTGDGQMLEGGVPLRFIHLPAVSVDGAVIAVAEERNGWGAVPIPGIRLIDRRGRTLRWLPLGGVEPAVTTAIRDANAALAEHRWLPLVMPEAQTTELSAVSVETTLVLDHHRVIYRQRDEGDYWLPPSIIRVIDRQGATILTRTDTESAWSASPPCSLPAFQLVGANDSVGVVLFTTGLGLGSHNCDGVEQRPSWHVLAY